jgi:hypothetical protein
MADVYGVFSRCFVDCGNDPFTIFDKDGEQLKEVFVNHISSVRIDIFTSEIKMFYSRKESLQLLGMNDIPFKMEM